MLLDFETLLVLLTLITGIVWFWDRRRDRRRRAGETLPRGWFADLCRSLFPVILIVLVIRSFIVEPFRIPSGSMIPTLVPGDFILVSKFAYGIRLPVIHTKIFDIGEPERGDVVVFRYPVDPSQDYIKRVVGLPGDVVRYVNKRLYVNGELMAQDVVGPWRPGGPPAEVRREEFGDDYHQILIHQNSASRGFVYQVPEGTYFMMGDNRDRSSDSRFWGPVPEENLVGEAFLIWMSWDHRENGVHWSRIGNVIE